MESHSGRSKVIIYLSPKGPVRKSGRLIEKRQPDQRHEVLDAIAKRLRHMELALINARD
ncbi:MAG: hypothetical protein P8X79_20630 [Reinekea sp.]